MMIIGCDYHPGFQQIAFVDTETGELQERRLEHREEAEKFYRDLAAQGMKVRVGMEASGHARWFDVDAAWPTCEAVRHPECAGILLAAAGDVQPCRSGAVPEARESGVGAGAGIACGVVAGTGGVASDTR